MGHQPARAPPGAGAASPPTSTPPTGSTPGSRTAIRTGKDTGIGKFPSTSLAINQAWQAAALTAATLLAWLSCSPWTAPLATAEPKTLRYRILHAAARLTRSGRRRRLKIAATWPWAPLIITAWDRITALPQAP